MKPNLLYGRTIEENKTIYTRLVECIDVPLIYSFSCTEPGDIAMQYTTETALEDPSKVGWSKAIGDYVSIEEKVNMENATGAELSLLISYDADDILAMVDNIQENIGIRAGKHTVTTIVDIDVTDETEFGLISKTIELKAILSINRARGGSGTITVTTPEKHLTDVKTKNSTEEVGSTGYFRAASLLSLLAWIPIGSFFTWRKYRSDRSRAADMPESERILQQYDVLESQDMPNLPVQTMSSMDDLAEVAEEYGSMIFHAEIEGRDVFYASEEIVYQYVVSNKKD
ncbi:hypothetical protein AKJ65_03370 [candidate division MSBL1 archaeon SCGC-AAA259E19]|uniref:Uncharacterized protein n=1 Tax=candidate division MSBL1 archaeon SCGC-AAA259E19 TaxID=1698264 RepID=A0A133UKT2_9EURY|nr:hypothetical protein AKJ65_03370 [candidate division MSBL1 archaeon SCGC-AAA259E19]